MTLQQITTNDIAVTRVLVATVAGAADQNCSAVDMSGFEGVIFIASFGDITSGAVTALKAQQDTASGMGTAQDLEDSAVDVADDDDDQTAILTIHRPRERYVRAVIERATQNAVIDGVIAIQYGAGKKPPAHDTDNTIVESKILVSPDEGTA